MATRAIMLMGAFQGNLDDMSISQRNLLKWWERWDVFSMDNHFLKHYTNNRFKPFHGQNIKCVARLQPAAATLCA